MGDRTLGLLASDGSYLHKLHNWFYLKMKRLQKGGPEVRSDAHT